jgi:GrpB-like predicted nucleotidyltransferase (UPF0157 family)
MDFTNYINFRDYLNSHHDEAKDYEDLKVNLMKEYQNDRNAYTLGKAEFIEEILKKASHISDNNINEC